MNKARRAFIGNASTLLGQAIDIIRSVKSDEEYALSNMPENMQDGDRCEAMENAIDKLEDAISSMQEADRSLEEAMNS